MLELVDGFRRALAQIFDGILIAEPVRPLHRVVHVPAPIVGTHIAEGRGDAALRRNGMRARGKHLGDAGGAQASFARADHGTEAGAAGADHHHIVGVVDDWIGAAVDVRCLIWRGVLRHLD